MSTNNTQPTTHHPLSPSKFPAWAECADFDPPEEKTIEDLDIESIDQSGLEEKKDDAKGRGTAQHIALAKILSQERTTQASAFDGLSSQEIENVRWTAEEVVRITEASGYSVHDIRTEQRVSLLGSGFTELYYGTLDIEVGPILIDAKFGDERNYFAQLCGYALPKMELMCVDRIQTKTIYGRLRKTRSAICTRETAEAVVHSIIAKRCASVRTPKVCEYCGWCKRVSSCSALTGNVEALVGRRDDWPLKLRSAHASLIASDPVQGGIARFIWKNYLEPWGKAVEQDNIFMASGGVSPIGYTVHNVKGRIELKSAIGAVVALSKVGIPKEMLLEKMTISFGAMVETYMECFGKSKEKAEEAVEEVLVSSGVMTRKESSLMIRKKKDAEDLLRIAQAKTISQ